MLSDVLWLGPLGGWCTLHSYICSRSLPGPSPASKRTLWLVLMIPVCQCGLRVRSGLKRSY